MINLDIKITFKKIIKALVFKIDGGDINAKNVLIKQNITILFQIFVLQFKI